MASGRIPDAFGPIAKWINQHILDTSIHSAGGGALGNTVVTETDMGQSATAGVATTSSRSDHTHGTPSDATVGARIAFDFGSAPGDGQSFTA